MHDAHPGAAMVPDRAAPTRTGTDEDTTMSERSATTLSSTTAGGAPRSSVGAAPDDRHPAVAIAPPAESSRQGELMPEHSLLERWARTAARWPDEIALSDEHTTVTYRQADEISRALGALLDERLRPDDHSAAGVGPVPGDGPVPVGIMASQTSGGVLGVLGLAFAGRLLVVLDAHLPEARIRHVIALAGITEIVADEAHRALAATLVAGPAAVLPLDPMLDEAQSIAAAGGPIRVVPAALERGGTDGFNIVFTSGSTGAPKGVVTSHRAMLADVTGYRERLGLAPGERSAVVLPVGFAAGFAMAFGTIHSGAEAHLLDARDAGVLGLVDRIAERGITVLQSTPHLARTIADALGPDDDRLRGLRVFATVGEAVTGTDVAAVRPLFGPTTSFFNFTGSSETASLAFNEIAPGDPVPEGSIPAGEPAFDKEIRILREDGTTAAVGETGQLLCVSDAVTPGYWGAYEQTALRAGIAEDGRATWKQGDLARIDEDGKLTLLGRADDAVKVRGYLVEPSEIEAAIRRIDTVQEAVVTAIVQPGASTRLVAYVVGRAGRRTASPAAIRRALRAELPAYMVPGTIVPMVALPRNERGKVDRAELPPPPAAGTGDDAGGGDGAVATMDETTHDQWELAVGQIWAEVLGLPAVAPEDDFASLGGDSLAAEEMLAAVSDRIGVEVRSAEILEHPTLADFARRVRAGTRAVPSHPDVVKLTSGGGAPVFCFPGAGALGLTFVPLARHLADHDVYVFQQHGLERRSLPDWSVPAAARRFIELMRVVQPHGPYRLIGHSLGGLIALEIATTLAENGETVEHVVLLDTYLPRSTAEQGALEFARLPEREHGSRVLNAVRRGAEQQLRRVLPGGLPQVKRVSRRLRAYTAGVVRYRGQDHFDAFFDQASVMVRRHRVRPYDGRVTFVFADGNPDGPDSWRPYLRGEMRFPRLASEHSSLLREPHVTELAAMLHDVTGI
ncbi:AMP-dependent synthetase [Curtobacterium sp. MCBD17_028]|nr:AMP-dependent synthetase [Curtobacterium sp. MCBD17_028]